jgi:hypothetical protein
LIFWIYTVKKTTAWALRPAPFVFVDKNQDHPSNEKTGVEYGCGYRCGEMVEMRFKVKVKVTVKVKIKVKGSGRGRPLYTGFD